MKPAPKPWTQEDTDRYVHVDDPGRLFKSLCILLGVLVVGLFFWGLAEMLMR